MTTALETATEVIPSSSIAARYDKRLMVTAGGTEDIRRRRGLLPLRGVDPRRRPLHRPVDLRL